MVKGCGKRETLYDTARGHKWGTGIAQVYCTHNTLRHTHVHVFQMCYIGYLPSAPFHTFVDHEVGTRYLLLMDAYIDRSSMK